MASPVVIPTVTGQVREFWVFYRRYTDTTIHTAATAALTIFGLLIFLDPWFAALAIGSYVGPPVALYLLEDEPVPETEPEPGREGRPDRRTADRAGRTVNATPAESDRRSSERVSSRPPPSATVGDGDTDTDSDSDDGDTDSDTDGTDTDTDSDSDGTDTDSDSDSDDGDTDSDSDS
ncbi:hypothetical protein HTZ84_12535 [Haloterrigena sp. SYSU A558-1]|uniref:Uncharacterized protein n=1 Tax=Haloterrigena gelatinilytica TaxID=2741724 RepID=A0A8J8GJB4_9EURY|nr:hypothetical protein [Haloterrigena gelatinilytica]NUB91058.1 hypothetical protein [Haloterrigena gelatinilytica]NUC73129.1 hypothetical protein [Haloterrigena gelatinilytica]